jgi:hypothetical protein
MSTQYRLVQSGKTASGGCSAGQGSSEPVAPRIYFIYLHGMPYFRQRRPSFHAVATADAKTDGLETKLHSVSFFVNKNLF